MLGGVGLDPEAYSDCWKHICTPVRCPACLENVSTKSLSKAWLVVAFATRVGVLTDGHLTT